MTRNLKKHKPRHLRVASCIREAEASDAAGDFALKPMKRTGTQAYQQSTPQGAANTAGLPRRESWRWGIFVDSITKSLKNTTEKNSGYFRPGAETVPIWSPKSIGKKFRFLLSNVGLTVGVAAHAALSLQSSCRRVLEGLNRIFNENCKRGHAICG